MADSGAWERAYAAYRIKPTKAIKIPYTKVSKVPVRQPIEGAEAIKSRIFEINQQIKALKKEKLQLKNQLKPWIVEYQKKPWILYALRLENNHWYVGMSRNPERRFMRHVKGKGAQWTRLHKPLEIFETREILITDEAEASIVEDQMTLEYAEMYGLDKVRGGGYCQAKPRWPLRLYEK